MKAHVVVKVYSTGTSAIASILSSKKKARNYIDSRVESARKDGWIIQEFEDYCYGDTVKIIPENVPQHSEMFYIESREIV